MIFGNDGFSHITEQADVLIIPNGKIDIEDNHWVIRGDNWHLFQNLRPEDARALLQMSADWPPTHGPDSVLWWESKRRIAGFVKVLDSSGKSILD